MVQTRWGEWALELTLILLMREAAQRRVRRRGLHHPQSEAARYRALDLVDDRSSKYRALTGNRNRHEWNEDDDASRDRTRAD